jgi:3-oxoacyl-[acyl-carrier-protein] synthase-3
MIRAAITSVGHFLPEERLTNFDLEKLVDTSDEWIRTRTGITERRILRDPDKPTSFMAAEAARQALEKRGMDAADLDLIIVATVTPDMFFPATACLVQDSIGATRAWGFDVSAACSGFLFALSTAASFIEAGRHRNVMVIGADKMSTIVDWTDRNTCILFGDGAGAVIVEGDDSGHGIIDSIERCDGDNWEALRMLGGGSLHPSSHETIDAKMHYLFQEGRAVFKVAV